MQLGPFAALTSSFTWAFASTRYAQASRAAGAARVNLVRAVIVVPIYLTAVLVTRGGASLDGIHPARVGWLMASVVCSYGFADGLFFIAARRIGVPTALSIASTYPLWAALSGALFGGERFGPVRAAGTLLAVGGVVALVRLAPRLDGDDRPGAWRSDFAGVALAGLTSIFWAFNTVAIKHGATGITTWQANAVRYSLALCLLSATVVIMPRGRVTAPAGGWRGLVPAVLADAVLGSMCFVYGLASTDLAVGATLTSLAPLISVPIAIALGEERWSGPRFAAVAATVGGVILLVAFG
jgi:drug/metabolite transporter (DMT)-like permease